MRVVLLGAPGADRVVRSQQLVERFGLRAISVSALVRAAMNERTPLGVAAREAADVGRLIGDDILFGLLREALAGVDDFLLDGFPRDVGQARALDALLAELGKPLTHAVKLPADESTVMPRDLALRVAGYHERLRPVVDHYLARGLLAEL